MAIVVPDAGEIRLLTVLLKYTTYATNWTLHLYSNDYTPNAASINANFAEATFTGYSAATLVRASWNNPVVVSNRVETSYASGLSWTCGVTGQTIYGYWVLAADNTVLWAEKFGAARELGDTNVLDLTPKFAMARDSDDL
jgi:hypothetical protein